MYTRQAAEKKETDEEFFQSIPATLTDTEFKRVARDKAHADYLATLSFRQTLFGNHDKSSNNFNRWFEEHETEQLYNEHYKKNEDRSARVLNIMARKNREAKRNRGRRY